MKSKWLVAIIGAVLIGTAAITMGAGAPAKAKQVTEPWPAFTMVYEDRSEFDGKPLAKKYRLDYRNQKNWRIEVLENSGSPADVGSWAEYANDTVRAYDAVRQTSSETPGPMNSIHVVDEWLIPGRANHLMVHKAGWSQVAADKAEALRLVKTETLSCQAGETCTNGVRNVREERAFEPTFNIPLSVRQEVDGVVKRQVTVISLEIHK